MDLENSSQKKWIIKSENKILGPYSFDQVIDLIRKKQVLLIDEIRDPEMRWLYIRENAAFKEIVEEIRKEIDSKQESTKTYQSVSKTVAEEELMKTKTDVVPEIETKEVTRDMAIINELLSRANSEEEEIIEPQSTVESATPPVPIGKPPPSVTPAAAPVKSFGVKTDKNVQSKVKKESNKVVLAVVAVIALSIMSFFGYMFIQKKNNQKLEEEMISQVKRYKFLGLNQKASDQFEKLPTVIQKKLVPDLLDIFPILEEAGHLSYQDIKNLNYDTLTIEQKTTVELINFYNDMKKQNYGQAQERLVKATTLSPGLPIIKENEALLYLKKGLHSSAYPIYKNIAKQEKNGRILLGLALSYNGLSGLDKSTAAKDVMRLIETYTAAFYDFRKELLLAQITLAKDIGDDVLFKVAVKQFLNTPARMSEEFVLPSLLAPNSYTWKELSDIKSNVQKMLAGDELILFQLHDFLEQKQLSGAADFISANISRLSSSSTRDQMNLMLFAAQGRNKEAVTLEKSTYLDMSSELNQFLLAQSKLRLDNNANIKPQITFFETKKLNFYRDWILLDQLIKQNAQEELKTFLKEHFLTLENFAPVFTGKSMVN